MSLHSINEPDPVSPQHWSVFHHPLWALGFRPFYLLAAAFAALAIPLWVMSYSGWISWSSRNTPDFLHVSQNWHMHEMVFGVIIAVIIGFLYTAGKNWTGLWTPRRGHLALLAACWLAGRVAMLATTTSPAPASLIAALIDALFLPLATWPMYRVLRQSENQRNLFLVGLLSLLTIANMVFHASTFGWIALHPIHAIHAAILLIVLIESVIGARVIPMFTSNGAPGTSPIVHAGRDRITRILTVCAVLVNIIPFPALICAVVSGAAAIAIMVRLLGWKPHRTLRIPLLWILHVSYAWIAFGFALLALAAFQIVSDSTAYHALAVGSIAGLILGMMTRTALGHTGRPLKAGISEIWMYSLIQLGAVTRVGATFFLGNDFNLALHLSSDLTHTMPFSLLLLALAATCWSLAFLLYCITYGPYLFHERIDGREG